jgi:hypothetical protein
MLSLDGRETAFGRRIHVFMKELPLPVRIERRWQKQSIAAPH